MIFSDKYCLEKEKKWAKREKCGEMQKIRS